MCSSLQIVDTGCTDDLSIEGTIYPASQPNSAMRTVGHLCSEYTTEELEEHVHHLRDLELCLEHNKDKVIGKVVDAKIKPDKGVWIRAIVNASSDTGRQTIQRIKSKDLPGLSLSHEFCLYPTKGSQLDSLIQTAQDWQNLPHDKRREFCTKRFNELSVCKEPARKDCFIDSFGHLGGPMMTGTVSASFGPDQLMSVLDKQIQKTRSLFQLLGANLIRPDKNANSLAGSAGECGYISHKAHALLDLPIGVQPVASGIVSFSREAMESAAPVTPAPTDQSAQPAQAQAAPQANAGNPVFAAVAQQQAAQQQQIQQAAQNRDAQGRFVAAQPPALAQPVATQQPAATEAAQAVPEVPQVSQVPQQEQPAQEPATEAAPAVTEPAQPAPEVASDVQQQQQIVAAMQQAQETIEAQQKSQQEMQKQMLEKDEANRKQMEAMQKELADLKAAKEADAAQLAKVKQEQQAAAAKEKARMLQQLNATMAASVKALPNQQLIVPQPPQGDAANDVAKQSEYEAQLMGTTINAMQALQHQSNTANMEAQNNKRTASDALAAGYNFHSGGSMAPSPMHMGTVNCSADQQQQAKKPKFDPKADKNTVLGDQIRQWYDAQKQSGTRVDFNTCARQFNSFSAQLSAAPVTGTVSCSKGNLWNADSLVEGSTPTASLCMQHMQPQLFKAISDMNPGRIISPEETRNLMNTIQAPSAMPMR